MSIFRSIFEDYVNNTKKEPVVKKTTSDFVMSLKHIQGLDLGLDFS